VKGRRLALAAVLAAAAASAGCGDDEGAPAVGAGGEPGEGGILTWALDGDVRVVDPLLAANAAEELVASQIFEPLTEEASGPFGEPRDVPGLARSARPTADPTIWRLDLRQGVRFQDGTRFNASAVLANVDRWRASETARTLLPAEFEADAPAPDQVRFILAAPDPKLGERLSSPRLGIVSAAALGPDPASSAAGPVAAEIGGTGAFELRERDQDRLLLARNTEWWGTDRGLGPALEQVELTTERGSVRRAELLISGTVQVADGIGAGAARRVEADPLLGTTPRGDRRWRGAERSVRGVDSGGGTPELNRVWLTRLR